MFSHEDAVIIILKSIKILHLQKEDADHRKGQVDIPT